MKKILHSHTPSQGHWVGDGFPVRTVFSYNDLARQISPFLLLDYAGPTEFTSSAHIRGVGPHPHRGFETVSIIYQGEVEHRDSAGGGGIIGPGDVQWMTAGAGIIHEEKHSAGYAKKGGPFEMVQLWVNLPAKFKMVAPGYQSLLDADFPRATLPEGAGYLRVIAGQYQDHKGPAITYSPVSLWDVVLKEGGYCQLLAPVPQTLALFILSGEVQVCDSQTFGDCTLVILDAQSPEFTLRATKPSKLLVLGGQAFAEPIVGYGPFVMNTADEIKQALSDYQSGKMGALGVER